MTDDQPMSDDLALIRTEDGQREALLEAANLDSTERRLLLIANGHTRFADLLPHMSDAAAARNAARKLLEAGFVADAGSMTRSRQTFPMES